MKIKEAIRLLKQYDEEEEIIIAWWDKEEFDNAKEFETALDNQDCVDWGNVYDQLLESDEEEV